MKLPAIIKIQIHSSLRRWIDSMHSGKRTAQSKLKKNDWRKMMMMRKGKRTVMMKHSMVSGNI